MRQGAAKLWQCDMSPAQCFVIVYSLRLIIRSWLVHDVGQGPLIRFSVLYVPVVNSIIAGFVKLPRWNLFSLLSWFAFCFTMHIHTYFLVLSIHIHSCFIVQWFVVVWSFWCRISSLVFNSYTCLLGGCLYSACVVICCFVRLYCGQSFVFAGESVRIHNLLVMMDSVGVDVMCRLLRYPCPSSRFD